MGMFLAQPATTRLLLQPSRERLALWDYSTKSLVWELDPGIRAPVIRAACLSPDDRSLLLTSHADENHAVLVWDRESGKVVRRLPGLHEGDVRRMCFLPDGHRFVTAAADGYAMVWDLTRPEGEELVGYFDGHVQPSGAVPLMSLAVSPDGKMALTGDVDGYAVLWDIESCKGDERPSGRILHRFPRVMSVHRPTGAVSYSVHAGSGQMTRHEDTEHRGAQIWAVTFFPDGNRVVVADFDRFVRVFDVQSGNEVARHEQPMPPGADDRVLSTLVLCSKDVAASPDGRYVLVACQPQPRLWDLKTGKVQELVGHMQTHPNARGQPGGVHSVAFSLDGRFAITGGEDGTIRLWRLP